MDNEIRDKSIKSIVRTNLACAGLQPSQIDLLSLHICEDLINFLDGVDLSTVGDENVD